MGLFQVVGCVSALGLQRRKIRGGIAESGHEVNDNTQARNAPAKYKTTFKDCRFRFLHRRPSPVKALPLMMALDQDIKVVDFGAAQNDGLPIPPPLHVPTATFLRMTALARHSQSSRVVAAGKELESRAFLPCYDTDILTLVGQVEINLWKFVQLHVATQFCKLGHRLSMKGFVATAFDGQQYTSTQLLEKCSFLKAEYEWRKSQLAHFPLGPGKQHRLITMAGIKQQHIKYRKDFMASFAWNIAPPQL
ncbi:hypothetical protein BKA81DRAFT_404405 [Phyllosticta paracitricarpa]|uniref:Uncharacterized protein n=1 Tax=Phyllosticta paracitricarpa TaxID=2016321 RepID=A0ABR1N753_9PEZI